MKNKKQSIAMQMMTLAWENSNLHGKSWTRLNARLQSILEQIIGFEIEFEKDDFKNIFESFRGGYWFSQSSNGNNYGEGFYSIACAWNNSAAKSFESWTNREPFILNSNRLNEGSEFAYNNYFWRVSGFSKDNKTCLCVGYTDRGNKKGRKLLKFNNDQFSALKKEMTYIENVGRYDLY